MAFPLGAIAYWKLEDTADTVGSFPLTNTGTTTFAAGKIDNGADFGTTNTTKSLKNESIQATAYPITISGWVKPKVVNGDDYFVSLADDTVHYYGMKLRASDSHVVFRSNNTTQAADVDTGYVGVIDTWFHFAVNIIDTTHITIYINGTATNTNASIFVVTGLDRFMLGALGRSTPVEHFSGIIDEVGYWGRSLTTQEVTDLYNSGNGLQPDLTTSLVSYYKLDESSGNADDAVSTNDLTNANVTYGTGKINNGAISDSDTDRLYIADNASLSITRALSISTWVKFDSVPTSTNYAVLAGKYTGAGNQRSYQLYLYGDGNLYFDVSSNGSTASSTPYAWTPTTGVWYHVSATYTPSTSVIIYINGTSVVTNTTSIPASIYDSTAEFHLLGDNTKGGRMTQDEVGIWSRALSSTEVSELYNSGNGKTYPFASVYTLNAEVGAFTLTGVATSFGRLYTLSAEVGTFVLTGIDAIFKRTGWSNRSKSAIVTPSNRTKSSTATVTNRIKNIVTVRNRSKS